VAGKKIDLRAVNGAVPSIGALRRMRQLVKQARTWEEAWSVAVMALGFTRSGEKISATSIPDIAVHGRNVVIEAWSLYVEAKIRVGELLRTAARTEPRPTASSPAETKVVLAPNERHRCWLMAKNGNKIRAYIAEWQHKYITNGEKAMSLGQLHDQLRPIKRGDRPSEIVKPSDNWNFAGPRFGRLSDNHGPGYVPGDIYACILQYWTEPNNVVYAPMAGSGMILEVYNRRREWMRPEIWDLTIRCSDLVPRGQYVGQIFRHDVADGIPIAAPDLIVADIPYFAMCRRAYSELPQDWGNKDWWALVAALQEFGKACAVSQRRDQRVALIVAAAFADHRTGRRMMVGETVRCAMRAGGYELDDIAYASRHIQQAQNATMGRLNNRAREERIMLSDMTEVTCWRRL
jgi:hypothetical protein